MLWPFVFLYLIVNSVLIKTWGEKDIGLINENALKLLGNQDTPREQQISNSKFLKLGSLARSSGWTWRDGPSGQHPVYLRDCGPLKHNNHHLCRFVLLLHVQCSVCCIYIYIETYTWQSCALTETHWHSEINYKIKHAHLKKISSFTGC